MAVPLLGNTTVKDDINHAFALKTVTSGRGVSQYAFLSDLIPSVTIEICMLR